MDSYKSLLERKEYDLILTLSENDLSPEGLSYRAASFLAKGEPRRAMDIVYNNREMLFKHNPIFILKTNFELRFILRQFDEAYDDLSYFENLPYVSQEVEEYLHKLPKLIRSEERNSNLRDKYSREELIEKLRSDIDDYELISYLNIIGPLKAKDYEDELIYIIKNRKSSILKTYSLLFLIAAKSEKEVEFTKRGKTYLLVPAKTIPPFSGKVFESFLLSLETEINDPSISNIAKKLLNDYIFEIFPENIDLEGQYHEYLLAFSSLAYEHLASSFSLEEEALKKGISPLKVESLIKEIKETRANEETIKY